MSCTVVASKQQTPQSASMFQTPILQRRHTSGRRNQITTALCTQCTQSHYPRFADQSNRRKNRTGLPNKLRAGLESLSGIDLSGVRVYYNSIKPDRINAAAYTQGQDIYLGIGQEQYLPHESWHVVQQMQRRVAPQTQIQGVSINDNQTLEREADAMGARALQTPGDQVPRNSSLNPLQPSVTGSVVQRAMSGFAMDGCDFHAYIDIGLFAKPSLYEQEGGLSDSSQLENLAQHWQNVINTSWTGAVPCLNSTDQCQFIMHATVRAHPEARFSFQVPETNKIEVRERGERSWAFGRWGAWAHTDRFNETETNTDLTIAHETGHLLGLVDKYFYVGAMKSYPKFAQDIMADYGRDDGPPEFGPARARIMALKFQSCPCCIDGSMRRRPLLP